MKIVIINGHPDRESFNHALHKAYKTGALSAGNGLAAMLDDAAVERAIPREK